HHSQQQYLTRGPAKHHRIDFARNELTIAQLAQKVAILDNHLSAQHSHYRPAFYVPPLPRAIVTDVKILSGECLLDCWINQDDIRIAAGSNYSFPRIQPEDTSCVGRGDLGEALQRHTTPDYSLGVDYTHTLFGAEIPSG